MLNTKSNDPFGSSSYQYQTLPSEFEGTGTGRLIGKVMGLLALAFLFAYIGTFASPIITFIVGPYQPVYNFGIFLLSIIVGLIILVILGFTVQRKWLNLVLLNLLTLFIGMALPFLGEAFLVMALTLLVCLVYSWLTRRTFSQLPDYLFVALIFLILVGLIRSIYDSLILFTIGDGYVDTSGSPLFWIRFVLILIANAFLLRYVLNSLRDTRRLADTFANAAGLTLSIILNMLRPLQRPLFAVALAVVVGGIIIMLNWADPTVDRLTGMLSAYQALYAGAFGDMISLSNTLVKTTPLILASLSVAIAYRAGLFNIGAAGQIAIGAMVAGIIGLKAQTWPGWLLIPTMLIASMLAGAVWGGIVGALKAWRGAHEVVTTIMLNWVAFFVTDYFIDGPFKAPQQASQTNSLPPQATLPSVATFYNQTLGGFLPKIPVPDQYIVDVGIFFSLAAIVIYWFIISRTTFGYEIRVLGQNPKAARYAGIPIKRNTVQVMALAGAFAGLAGALHLMGQYPFQLIATTFRIDTTGFDAIGASLLGSLTPIGVLLGSLLFGGLRQGGTIMQVQVGVNGNIVLIIEAIVIFCIAAEFLPALQRALTSLIRSRSAASRIELLAGVSSASSQEPEHGNGEEASPDKPDSNAHALSKEE